MPDHYETLGVAKNASPAEVRKAYAQLARDRHPDRFTDPLQKERAQEFFKAMTEAFNTLSNEKARREYDAELAQPKLTSPDEIALDAYKRGLRQYETGDLQGAVDLLQIAIHNQPRQAVYHAALARVLSRTHPREAVQALERAAEIDPRKADYLVDMGRILLNQGLRLRARKAAEAALRLAPNDAEARQLLSDAG